MSERRRIAITGMSVNTPLGDTLDGFRDALLEGRSAVSRFRAIDSSRILAKVGADLSPYDVPAKIESLRADVPDAVYRRLRLLARRAPWSTGLTMLLAVDAFRDAGLFGGVDPERVAAVIAGHNINFNHSFVNQNQFLEEPDFIDGLLALHGLDTDHAGSVSEVLGTLGPIYTVGGACASGNLALRSAVDELRYHGVDQVVVVGAVFDVSPMDLHAMALMGAISTGAFDDTPEQASRPFDTRRNGFVPAHGGGALVLEDWESARRRGARIYAEVLGVEANAGASHLPQPSEEAQARLIRRLLETTGRRPEEVDFVSAHATSTPLGDLSEVRALRRVFGTHADRLRVNAPKSMLGHTCWAAPIVETVAAIVQMHAGRLHPSINIEELDPEVDLDVCAGASVAHEARIVLKNSFGFGGINCVSLLAHPDAVEG